MKYLIIIILILLGVILYLTQCNEKDIPDFSKEKAELLQNIEQLQDSVKIALTQRDSLLKTIPKIRTVIVEREREIDENIAKDSSNSIVEYRKALQENNYLPEGTEQLTFREIGIGSKLMARVPKLELQIKTYESTIQKDNEIFKDYEFQIKGYKDLNNIQNLEINKWQGLYNDTQTFWNSPTFLIGIGVVGTIAVVFLVGLAN